MTLETQLIEDIKTGKDVPLERALLIVSGCDTEEKIAEYQRKLDQLQEGFRNSKLQGEIDHYQIAESLFDYLHEGPGEGGYVLDGEFCFSCLYNVIDAQLSGSYEVGNCVGLAALYSVLGLRESLKLSVMASQSHVFSRLNILLSVDIEHAVPNGFDIESRRGYSERPLSSLIASVLINRGADKNIFNERECKIIDHSKAIAAISDYDKAIIIDPEDPIAYYNRGMIMYGLGNFEEAIADFDQTLAFDPGHVGAYHYRTFAESKLNRVSLDYVELIRTESWHFKNGIWQMKD